MLTCLDLEKGKKEISVSSQKTGSKYLISFRMAEGQIRCISLCYDVCRLERGFFWKKLLQLCTILPYIINECFLLISTPRKTVLSDVWSVFSVKFSLICFRVKPVFSFGNKNWNWMFLWNFPTPCYLNVLNFRMRNTSYKTTISICCLSGLTHLQPRGLVSVKAHREVLDSNCLPSVRITVEGISSRWREVNMYYFPLKSAF